MKPKYGWEFQRGKGLSLLFLNNPTVHIITSEDMEYWFGTTGCSSFERACKNWGNMLEGRPHNYIHINKELRDAEWNKARKYISGLRNPDITFDDTITTTDLSIETGSLYPALKAHKIRKLDPSLGRFRDLDLD